MSDQDIFAGADQEPELSTETKFEDLVGEGRKYKTTDDVARAVVEKDRFIAQLQRENAGVREALSKRINEEEFLKKLQEVARPNPAVEQEPPVEPEARPEASALTPEKVEEIIAKRETVAKRQSNLEATTKRLQEVYGDDYRSRVQTQAKAMGVNTEFLTSVAAESPEAFYRFMGLDQERKADVFSPPPRSSVVPSIPRTNVKDYNYYYRLRQEKGDAWYYSVPVQQEIWQAAKEAAARGEKFLP